jgi:hypothetical protein
MKTRTKLLKKAITIFLCGYVSFANAASLEELFSSIQMTNGYFAKATDYLLKGDTKNGCEYGKKAIISNSLYSKSDYPVELYGAYDDMMKPINDNKALIQKKCL